MGARTKEVRKLLATLPSKHLTIECRMVEQKKKTPID
jgi:hypothetical protein